MLAWYGVQGESFNNIEVARESVIRGVVEITVPILIEKIKENKDYQVVIAGYSLGKWNS